MATDKSGAVVRRLPLSTLLTPMAALLRRELLERVRSGGHFAMRTIYVLVLFVIVLLVSSDAWLGTGDSLTRIPGVGRILFQTFSLVQYALVVLITPLIGAGAVVEERKERSLGLLLLTELTYGQIASGKLLARLGVIGLIVLSNVPILSLASMLGGVEWLDVVRVFVLTVATAGSLLGLTIFISSVSSSTVKAAVGSYMVLVVSLVSLFGLIELDVSWYQSWHPVVTTVMAVADPLALGGSWWVSALVQAGVASVSMVGAALAMRRSVRSVRGSSETIERGTAGAVEPARVWDNPIAWREWTARGRLWRWVGGTFAVGVVFALLTAALADSNDDMQVVVMIGINVVLFAFSVFTLSVGASAFAQEKHEQTLELLNLTFLKPWQVVAGKMVAVLRLWLYAVALISPTLVVTTLLSDRISIGAIVAPQVTLLVLMLFLGAMGTFYSLVAESPLRAALPAIGTFLYIALPLVWWPLLMIRGESKGIGLALALGYLVVWTPMLLLVARNQPRRVIVGFVLVGLWTLGVVVLPAFTQSEVMLVALNPFAVQTTSVLSFVTNESNESVVVGTLAGVVYFLSGAGIFLWAAARLLEDTQPWDSESPVVAALLSALIPGTGQIYVGRSVRGAVVIIAYVVFVFFVVIGALLGGPVVGLLVLIGHVVGAADAWRVADQAREARHAQVRAQRQRRGIAEVEIAPAAPPGGEA